MPPRQQAHDPAYLDEHHEAISRFAETYFDDEEERDGFVTELMSRRGYTPTTRTEWAAPAPQPPKPANQPPAGPAKPSYFKQR